MAAFNTCECEDCPDVHGRSCDQIAPINYLVDITSDNEYIWFWTCIDCLARHLEDPELAATARTIAKNLRNIGIWEQT